jgi:hypothetical protein
MFLRLIARIVALLLLSAAVAFSPELDSERTQRGAPADPLITGAAPAAGPETAPIDSAAGPVESAGAAQGQADSALPVILRSEADLPAPVRETRQKLIEAARSGDMEKLRALMKAQPEAPSVAFGDPGDPIDYLKALSSDADGREILAILLEVLESGFVHVSPGTSDELYVWPYFAQYPLEALTPPQLVELFTLLTATDYEDMKSYGSYTFFRVGIAPDGRWLFFLAGD